MGSVLANLFPRNPSLLLGAGVGDGMKPVALPASAPRVQDGDQHLLMRVSCYGPRLVRDASHASYARGYITWNPPLGGVVIDFWWKKFL